VPWKPIPYPLPLLLLAACQASATPPPPAAPVAPAAAPASCPSLTDALLDVGSGVSLHIHCTGSGAPTVILEAGAGVPAGNWADVQRDVSQLTRVCSYDRAGLGDSSPPASKPHTMQQMVQELQTLLGRAGIGGPYVLVGHSLGGANVRLYASQHPDDVSGMVLVDSSTVEQFAPPTDAEIAEARDHLAKDPEGFDLVTFRAGLAALRAAGLSLSGKPLVVLSHGHQDGPPPPAGFAERWEEGQKTLPLLSTNSARLVAEKSGHFIQDDQPQLVIASVRQVVEAARSHGRVDAGALSPLAQQAPPAPDLDAVEKTVFASFVAHDPKMLFDLFGPEMAKAAPLDHMTEFMTAVLDEVGPFRSAERTPGGGARFGTWRVHAERDTRLMNVGINGRGRIDGFWVVRDEPPVTRSDVPLGLPFRGEWTVFWGGDRKKLNHHLDQPSQRRAADLVITAADGKTYRTDGKTNADYLDYGQPVLAVADGTVVTAIDGVPENEPGALNPFMAPGNMIVLQHGPSLYSVYAHLQPGRLTVRPGAKVKRGATLGLCGNSGNSSEPHLHFQLQDGPAFEKSWGVEAVFPQVRLTRGGTSSVASGYTFLKGDRIGAP
jgi:pimeloyl-ACP methyl ester carboxylesterase